MMFKPSVKLQKELMDRVAAAAEAAGYSSAQEFIEHVLERELARIGDEAESKEDLVKKLKGLGYLE
jgi:metal-responsive CopG/Arc/MetJ family transcriptional regulator